MPSRRYVEGLKEMRRHLGPEAADGWLESIQELAPEFARVNVEFPFGDLYTRTVVDDKTRELCTVAALVVQGFALPEVKVHVKAALRCGAARAEIIEIITQMIAYCGFPAATNALLATKDAFVELDAESDESASA